MQLGIDLAQSRLTIVATIGHVAATVSRRQGSICICLAEVEFSRPARLASGRWPVAPPAIWLWFAIEPLEFMQYAARLSGRQVRDSVASADSSLARRNPEARI